MDLWTPLRHMIHLDQPCHCEGGVPIVSIKQHGMKLLLAIRPDRRMAAVVASLDWLGTPHDGVSTITGATTEYNDEQRVWIERDLWACAALPCPYRQADGACLLGGLPDFTPVGDARPYSFLPALIATQWAPEALHEMIASNLVADVKRSTLSRREHFPRPAAFINV